MAVAFARVLRGTGIEVPAGATVEVRARHLDVSVWRAVRAWYWAGRATMVNRPEDVAVFDRAFAVFWDLRTAISYRRRDPVASEDLIIALDLPGAEEPEGDDADTDAPVVMLRWSRGRSSVTATSRWYTAPPSSSKPDGS